MAITRATKVTYEKIIDGQKVTFNYEHGEEAPVNVNISVPVQVMNEGGQVVNGYINLNVVAAKKGEARLELSALLGGIMNELDNVVTNYQNPEAV